MEKINRGVGKSRSDRDIQMGRTESMRRSKDRYEYTGVGEC